MYEPYPGSSAGHSPYSYGESSTPYRSGYYPYRSYGMDGMPPGRLYGESGTVQEERAKLKPGRKMPKEQALQLRPVCRVCPLAGAADEGLAGFAFIHLNLCSDCSL
jgi:hypothetical protein